LRFSKESPSKYVINGLRLLTNSPNDAENESNNREVDTRNPDDAPDTQRIESDYIAFKDVSIVSPDGVTLVESIAFFLYERENKRECPYI
jgi:hypothetical protein